MKTSVKIFVAVLALLCAVSIVAVFAVQRKGLSSAAAVEVAAERMEGKRAPVIVELFTSEGCSSCPPADAVLAQLDKTQPVAGVDIIAMSEHVDYWNYIGWADPFSSPAFSARQESYAAAFGTDRIYTPQMIVDGQAEFVGGGAAKAREAIARAARAPKAEVTLARTAAAENGRLLELRVNVRNVPAISAGDTAEIVFAITETDLSSKVSRGENSGRKLSHASVVRELRSLGQIAGMSKSFEAETSVMIPESWKRGDLRAIAFVQERAHRRILGAASLSLSKQ